MKRLSVLNAESRDFSAEARAALGAFADLEEGELDRPALLRRISGFDALIVRLGHRVDAEVMNAGSRLKVIVTATTGLDHIELEAARQRGIDVLSLKGETVFLEGVTATAEHTWALLLALARHLPAAVADVRAGSWQRDRFRGIELSGRTLGVIGYGRLGRMVARYGVAFGMRVLVADPALPDRLPDGIAAAPDLATLLSRSDVVSVHVPLAEDSRYLIDAAALSLLRPGAILINTARGEVVEPDALLAALGSGRLAGAALDVVSWEHPGDGTMSGHPLVRYAAAHNNLIITPHIGGATWDSMRKTEIFMAGKLRLWAQRNGFGA